MAERQQSYANHVRWFPPFHFFVLPVLLANVLNALRHLWLAPSLSTGFAALVAAALLLTAVLARMLVTVAQDRVIRLEMRLRLARVLPREQQSCVDNLTLDQLVALRFASDDELPGLCRKVVDDRIANRKQIKQLIKTWTPDSLRV